MLTNRIYVGIVKNATKWTFTRKADNANSTSTNLHTLTSAKKASDNLPLFDARGINGLEGLNNLPISQGWGPTLDSVFGRL